MCHTNEAHSLKIAQVALETINTIHVQLVQVQAGHSSHRTQFLAAVSQTLKHSLQLKSNSHRESTTA